MLKKEGKIIDQYGREHSYLRISLTEKCNLRCTYCMPAEGVQLTPNGRIMTGSEILDIAKVFVDQGVTKIRLTGGEPLLRKDFDSILLGLSQLPVQLSLTTNGVLVHKHIETLKQAGIKTLNVSLDTLQPEKFHSITLFNRFQRVQENIQLLIDNGFHVKLNVVAMKGFNDDELVDFVELTKTSPLDVRFIEFMPFDSNNWSSEKTITQAEILTQLENHFGNRIEKLVDESNFIAREYQLKEAVGTFGIISTVSNPFCSGCNRIRLTADGKIKNCLFSNQEMNLLQMHRNGEDLVPFIQKAVWKKHKTRGGMESNSQFSDPTLNQENRSMITIGG